MNNLINAFNKRKQEKEKSTVHIKRNFPKTNKIDVPKGLYEKCPKCAETVNMKVMYDDKFICKNCGEHFKMRAIDRISITVDTGSFIEKGLGYITLNPLFQDGYDEKIKNYQKKTNLDEAYIYGYARINGSPCVVGVMDSYFLMGSMGSVVGEKVTRSFEYAIYKKLPMIIFTASGGARMQEGIYSLMQMAKTSAAVLKHSEQGLLYISVLTHPTTGGVTASFASLGDITLAEPGALIGFAGPRVIEQTINQKLPEGFQRSEFLKEKGFVDKVVRRSELKHTLSKILELHRRY
ncbi:Acetyl-coenzyme A carboxylase carboxyl transferase subunit beta [Candidatus Izimaplasma bacterium HR1]|jgi:acetyl-CoA carboxylase carboxyl transferase subunit beta|uniref:acetyl-CoA carboxylase, carboxyltransferase subunit beta n=1 Tax=Candidatus Izimoplasma sp. HR1 TaxID=1541959 RepID=UPI0004F5D9ED|nr:Acetyl-coenzyme A carboxylase carboxyl transferase subunit beta [Candidatus Izimaplasma bacterium HR1]